MQTTNKTKLRIVSIFLNPFYRTGGQRRYFELVAGLAQKGHDVFMIQNDVLDLSFENVKHIQIPVKKRKLVPYSITFFYLIKKYEKEIRQKMKSADWVIIFGETNILAAIRLSKILESKLLYSLRSNAIAEADEYIKLKEGGIFGRIKWSLNKVKHKRFAQSTAKNANKVIVQSQFDYDTYIDVVPKAKPKTHIIPGNIGLPRFSLEYKNTNQSKKLKKIVYVGNFGLRKGVDFLLNAIILLKERDIQVSLDIVGDGDQLPQMKQYAQENDVEDQIQFHGRSKNPLLFLKESDLLVIPSLFDSFPNTVLEALHVGTLVIGSRVGGIPYILNSEDLLFDPGDSKLIADKIEYLYINPNEFMRLKKHCEDRAEKFRFDWVGEFEKIMVKN